MKEIYTHGIPAMPNSYHLTDDAINALTNLVNHKFYDLLKNSSLDDKLMILYQKRLDEYMMKQYPDLSNKMNSLSLILEEQVKNIEKRLKEIEKREKSVLKSESIYEDIYEMKDRMKVLDNFICNFKSKLKKAFDL
jgi:hypothetical protein